MCGFTVIFSYAPDAPPVSVGEVRQINERMRARGPDGEGEWFSSDGRVGLGHRRLAIIDPGETGAQPMQLAGSDGAPRFVITYNGEIYNYKAIRDELTAEGRLFASNSDTEVLLHLYDRDGPEMVHKLRGMFAFAIWDAEKQGVFLARDPFGIKPLYYATDGKTVRVASQVKALLAGGRIDTSPDPAGHVGFFMFGYVPEPHTLYKGVQALPSGSSLWIDRKGMLETRKYFDVCSHLISRSTEVSAADVLRKLHTALSESVGHHLVADVPVGVFLSAGLDSATVTGLAAERTNAALRTMTLQFDELAGGTMDEAPLAEEIAALYQTQHQTRTVRGVEFHDDMDHLFESMDQPSIDGSNTYFVSKEAAAMGLKVALSGLGGDELFGGYPSFRQIPRLAGSLGWIPGLTSAGRAIRYVSAPFLKHLTSPKYASLFEYGGSYSGAYLLRRGLYLPWELPDVMDGDMAAEGWRALQPLVRLEETIDGIVDDKARVSALELTWYMQNQLLRDSDWAGMAHSIEIRTPLVDATLFAEIAGLNASKLDMAAAPHLPLPSSVLNRPKTGFYMPIREWLVGEDSDHSEERGYRGWARRVYTQVTQEHA